MTGGNIEASLRNLALSAMRTKELGANLRLEPNEEDTLLLMGGMLVFTMRAIELVICDGLTRTDKDKAEASLVLSKDQSIALKQLATERQIASKNYLMNSGNITHDRLILCEPELQIDDTAIAGVDVNI